MCQVNPNASDGVCYAPGYEPLPYVEEKTCELPSSDSYAEAEKFLEKPPQAVTGKNFVGVGTTVSGTISGSAEVSENTADDSYASDIGKGILFILGGLALIVAGA